jgi:hypothetical protein
VGLEEAPHEPLSNAGAVSPIFGAFGGSPPALPQSGAVVLLFPKSPRLALHAIANNWSEEERSTAFVSHGLASVGFFAHTPERAQDLAASLAHVVDGSEIWPFVDRVVVEDELLRVEPEPAPGFPRADPLDDSDLPYDAATQVRQLSANLSAFAPLAARYAAEYAELVSWLQANVQAVSNEIRTLTSSTDPSEVQLRNDLTATLVELNAGLTMLQSQLLSGTHPHALNRYAVAEYSLLGIGGVVRGMWRFYRHLSDKLRRGDHLGRIANAYEIGSPFPIFANRQTANFEAWETSKIRLDQLKRSDESATTSRLHILYFSSRYGFHETLNTMSASWQCVYASASRDWNLLTLSHEFLHAHVRELVAQILGRFTYAEIEEIIRKNAPETPWESMAGAMVSILHHTSRVRRDAPPLQITSSSQEIKGWKSVPSEQQVANLLEGQMRRYLQEILVHTLDYLYVYDGSDALYIGSIWGSWSYVPSVVKRLPHYVLRSLLALAGRSDTALTEDSAFADAFSRLESVFAELDAGGNALTGAALSFMRSEEGRKRLEIEFEQAYFICRLARTFLFDQKTAREIQEDQLTLVVNNVDTYGLIPGEIPDGPIESPTQFIIDQFSSYPQTPENGGRAYESLWQVLLMIDDRTHYPSA